MSDGKLIAGLCLKVPLCSEDVSALFSYTEKIRADGFQAGAASRDVYIEQLELALLQIRKAICGDIHNTDDLLDLVASRDAEVTKWIERVNSWTRDCERLADERDQLRAQINVLRELVIHSTDYRLGNPAYEASIATTPKQSLTEYRNKVIEAFVNEFSRHVGGDGEFWLHELQDFAMKEQP